MSLLHGIIARNAPFDAVSTDTRQLERYEQTIEVTPDSCYCHRYYMRLR
jgi:hypothetical protein